MATSLSVKEYSNVTKLLFTNTYYPKRIPFILKNIDIGECIYKWNVDYLISKSNNQKVTAHVSPTSQMDFINKNFVYKTLCFDDFLKRAVNQENSEFFISKEEKYYLRSLGNDPRKEVADFRKNFPDLSDDIIIPDFFPSQNFFSSVLRIGSAGIQLWTHYDVMDNFLIQISGKKRIVLFCPQDALYLYLKDDKSEVLDIDNPDPNTYPDFCKATRLECILSPGDILFIPALWFHNVTSLDFGISVNIFWKHLNDEHYDKKGIYGNKDHIAASKAFQILDRALKALDDLPEEYKDFYARRMVIKIQNKAYLKCYFVMFIFTNLTLLLLAVFKVFISSTFLKHA